MSTSAQPVPFSTTPVDRRFYTRIVPQAPIFVAFNGNDCEEGLLLNLSENGLLVSTPAVMTGNFVARLSIPLNGLPKPVLVTARVVWASGSRNFAGIQLLDLSEHDRERIRKWAARESTQASHSEPGLQSADAAPRTASSESSHAQSSCMEETTATKPLDILPLAPPQLIRTQSSSITARPVMWALLAAIVCLAAAFLVLKAAPGNPFARFVAKRHQSTSATQQAQDVQSRLENADTSNRIPASQAASPAPIEDNASANTPSAPSSVPKESRKTVVATSDRGPVSPATALAQNRRDESRTASISRPKPALEINQNPNLFRQTTEHALDERKDLSLGAAIPAVTAVARETNTITANSDAPPELPSDSPAPPNFTPPLPIPVRPNDAPSVASPTIPANPPSSAFVARSRPSRSPKSDATVIKMDAPRNQVLEVHLPGGYPASFFNLPGVRVLESPAVTMRIQRSVLMPATHSGWPFNRNKKVVVGELISRVDPQAAQIPSSPGNTVRVRARVAKDGRIENVRLILGPPNLAPAVAKALHEWRYQPTLVDDKAVETQCYVVFQFHEPAEHAARR
jgi:PilZ domain/Gram-negative bacterial TonB protein C-terminal